MKKLLILAIVLVLSCADEAFACRGAGRAGLSSRSTTTTRTTIRQRIRSACH